MKGKEKLLNRVCFLFVLFGLLMFTGCYLKDRDNVYDPKSNNYFAEDQVRKATDWTFMIFAGADNNLEEDILLDINEMQQGMKNVEGINLIVFIDRSPDYSSDKQILGENFSGGKIFRITGKKTYELYGQEAYLPDCRPDNYFDANTGDPELLQSFVQFSKHHYPADHYALIISSHGGGAAKRSARGLTKSTDGREVSADWTSNDHIYTAELTDALTDSESVDLLGYDACLMGSIEVAYQYRYRPGSGSFSADVMAASPASEWSPGWNYNAILQRFAGEGVNVNETNDVIEDQGTNEQYFDAASLTALQLGSIIVEEFYDQFTPYRGDFSRWDQSETMSCYDLQYAEGVKTAVDDLVQVIDTGADKNGIESLGVAYGSFPWPWETGQGPWNPGSSTYTSDIIFYFSPGSFSEMVNFPFHDLYDFAAAVDGVTATDLSGEAAALRIAVDNLVVYSFGGMLYDLFSNEGDAFQNGKNGIHIYFPRDDDFEGYGAWYNSIDIQTDLFSVSGYGKLAWCSDGADSDDDDGNPTNWFELMDILYDTPTDPDFNRNGYTP